MTMCPIPHAEAPAVQTRSGRKLLFSALKTIIALAVLAAFGRHAWSLAG